MKNFSSFTSSSERSNTAHFGYSTLSGFRSFFRSSLRLVVLTLGLFLFTGQGWGETTVDCSGASATGSTGNTNKHTQGAYTMYAVRGGGGWGVNSGLGYQAKPDAILVFKILETKEISVVLSNNGGSNRDFTLEIKPFKSVAIGEEFISVLEYSSANGKKYVDCVSSGKNLASLPTTSVFYNTDASYCTLNNVQLNASISTYSGTLPASAIGREYTFSVTIPAGVYAVGFSGTPNSAISVAGIKFSSTGCTDKYTLNYWTAGEDAVQECFVQESGYDYRIKDFTMKSDSYSFWVGYNTYKYNSNLGENNAKSADVSFREMRVAGSHGCGTAYYPEEGTKGDIRIWTNSGDDNLYAEFIPYGYVLRIGTDGQSDWESIDINNNGGTNALQTAVMTLPDLNKKAYVNLQSQKTFSSTDAGKNVLGGWTNGLNISALKMADGTDAATNYNNWHNISNSDAGKRGVFRFWTNSCDANGALHFVPYYRATYDEHIANNGYKHYSPDVPSDGTDAERTITLPAGPAQAPDGFVFAGWNTAADGSGTSYAALSQVVLTSDLYLYDSWNCIAPTEVNLTATDGKTSFAIGSAITLTASGTGIATGASYQWYKGGTAESDKIVGATSKTYALTANATGADAGTYYCVVTNGTDCETTADITIAVSESTSCEIFTLVMNNGLEDENIAHGTSLTLTSAYASIEGGSVILSNRDGSNDDRMRITRTGGGNIHFNGNAAMVQINLDKALSVGDVIEFTQTYDPSNTKQICFTTGTSRNATYKTTDGSYTVAADLAGATTIYVWRAESGGTYLKTLTITSNNCGPELPSCPEIEWNDNMVDQNVCYTSEFFVWSAIPEGEAKSADYTKTYSWKKNGSTFSSNAAIDPKDAGAGAGTYEVTVTVSRDGYKSTSATKTLTASIATPVSIIAPSVTNYSVAAGSTQTLSVDATGTDLVYQWYKNNVISTTSGVVISDANAASYSFSAIDGTTYYYCVVTDVCGNTVTSAVFEVEASDENCLTFGSSKNVSGNGTKKFFDNSLTVISNGTGNSGSKLDSDPDYWEFTSTSKITQFTITGYISSSSAENRQLRVIYGANSSSTTETTLTLPQSSGSVSFSISGGAYYIKLMRPAGNTAYMTNFCYVARDCTTPTTFAFSAETASYTIGEDFTAPSLDKGSLTGGVTYTSSNTGVATVNETTGAITGLAGGTTVITATYEGDETYCSVTATYTLTVTCSAIAPKITAVGALTGCNTTVSLKAVKSTDDTDYTTGTFQWYKDGVAISGATSDSYTVTVAGLYTLAYTDGCTSMSVNSANVEDNTVDPKVIKLTPFHYYRIDDKIDYTKEVHHPIRHLFIVEAGGSTGSPYQVSLKKNGSDWTPANVANWIYLDTDGETVLLDMHALRAEDANYHLAVGDVIDITVAPRDACNTYDNSYAETIQVTVSNKPLLAFIVSGADGDGTKVKKDLKLNGDFLTGYNKADLKVQDSQNSVTEEELPLYTAIKEDYIVIPVNGYAEFNLLNYEPFDLLFLTDFIKTDGSGDKSGAKKRVDELAALVDYRPLFSTKCHFRDSDSKTMLPKWVQKGFTSVPTEPKQTQKWMNIVCYAHPMFDSYKERDDIPHEQASGETVFIMADQGGFDKSKAVQGFEMADLGDNFVVVAVTHYNAQAGIDPETNLVNPTSVGTDDRLLIASCERQYNINARMLLLSINADAHSFISEQGIEVIKLSLAYLLKTDLIDVTDCSLTFDNGALEAGGSRSVEINGQNYTSGDGRWNNPANWDARILPTAKNHTRVIKPCTVSTDDAVAMNVKICTNHTRGEVTEEGRITIASTGTLSTTGGINRVENGQYLTLLSTRHEDLVLEVNAAFIHGDREGSTKATVKMQASGNIPEGSESINNWNWQYIGTPFNDDDNANNNYMWAYLYKWNTGSQAWDVVPDRAPVDAWAGYCLSQESGKLYTMYGTLVSTANHTFIAGNGDNVFANSWSAPIDITQFLDEDFTNVEKTIYLFNTGADPDQEGSVSQTTTSAGQYVSIPISASAYTGTIKVIPSMQGFFVTASSAGRLVMNYDRLVRGNKQVEQLHEPMRAPRKVAMADDAPAVLEVRVDGTRYADNLSILEREDFTTGFDNGWDGAKWPGNAATPQLYVVAPYGNEAVSSIPDYEGTILGFQAGEDSVYTFSFNLKNTDDELYLLDNLTNQYTLVDGSAPYTFSIAKGTAANNRFVLTRNISRVPTDITNVVETDGGLLISNPSQERLTLQVYDAAGRLCSTYTDASSIVTIQLPEQKGVYLVNVVGATNNIVRKIVR